MVKPIKITEWKERIAKYNREEYYGNMGPLGHMEAITKLKRIENTMEILDDLLVNKRATRLRQLWRWVSTPLRARDIKHYSKELDDRLDKFEALVRREQEPSIIIKFGDPPRGDPVPSHHEYLNTHFPSPPNPTLSV